MQPINYMTVNPQAAMLGGIELGAGMEKMQIDRQNAALAQQAAIQKQQAAMQQQQDLTNLAANPTAQGIASTMVKYPSLAEGLSKSFATLESGRKQNEINFISRNFAAIESGRPELAIQNFRERAKSDPEAAQHLDMFANLLEADPKRGKALIGMMASAAVGPEKFLESYGKFNEEQRAQGKAPFELAKAEQEARGAVGTADEALAKAETAKVTAANAADNAILDLQKKGWDIKALQNDIEYKKEANRISAMNAAISREGNDLKRQDLRLKIKDAEEKIDSKIREKVATAEAGASNIDNMLNTIERIKSNPSLNSVLGSLEGNSFYPNATLGTVNPFGNGDERADAIALIDTLGSQAFLSQIPNIKGMGALSNAEGEKLQSALVNLSRKQSEKQFRESLDEASRLLNKGRQTLSKSTGIPLSSPDTPAKSGPSKAANKNSEIDDLVKKYTK